jgi:RHS repeat-associated protein
LVRSVQRLIFIDRKGMQGKNQIFTKTGAAAYINEYYPFGLVNQQTSSTQYGSKEQRYKYNGKELMKDFGLEAEDYGARLYSPQIGRWSVIDKMADKYARVSPYNYTLNNPIKFIDPDGNDVHVFGKDAQKTVDALGRTTNLTLTYDTKTGLVSASGEAKTAADYVLSSAFSDANVNVNLYVTSETSFTSLDGSNQPFEIGAFDGSEIKDGKVETTQIFNAEQSEKAEKAGLSTVGQDAQHEILESYIGGKDNPGEKYSNKSFSNAHQKASELDPKLKELEKSFDTKKGTVGLKDPKTLKSADNLRNMTEAEKKKYGGQ